MPQLVVEPHSQRIVVVLQVLPVEQLVEVQGTGPQLPSVWHRYGPHAVVGLTRQSGAQRPIELSAVRDWQM